MDPVPDYLLLGSNAPVTCLEFANHPKQTLLVTGMQNGAILIWNLKSRRVMYENSDAHQSNSVLVVFPNCEEKDFLSLISQGRDGLVKQWKVNYRNGEWNEISNLKCQALNFCRLSLCKHHSLIFVPSEHDSSALDAYHKFTKLEFILRPTSIEKKYGMLMDSCSQLTSDQSHLKLFGAYENGSIIIWLMNINNILHQNSSSPSSDKFALYKSTEANFHTEVIITIDYNETTSKGISGSADGSLCLWLLNDNTDDIPTISLIIKLELGKGVGCARFRHDGLILAVGLWDSTFIIFGGNTLKHLATVDNHDESITSLCFNEKTKELVVGSKDMMISLWSFYKDK